MIISSESYRQLVRRAPATIQAQRAHYSSPDTPSTASAGSRAHVFANEATQAFAADAVTGMIELDGSSRLGTKYPATTQNLLARYLVIREDEELELDVRASSVLFIALKGKGRSFQEDQVIEWGEGDMFLFPGGTPILNEAPHGDVVLFVVTDEPLLAGLGCLPPPFVDARVEPTHFVARTIAANLEDRTAQAGPDATQTIVQFSSARFDGIGCVAPMLAAGVATLSAGAEQTPHCHDADTLSVYVASEGLVSRIEGEEFQCAPGAALLTPAGALHSQRNTGAAAVFGFFVQDRGPRPVRTWWPQADASS